MPTNFHFLADVANYTLRLSYKYPLPWIASQENDVLDFELITLNQYDDFSTVIRNSYFVVGAFAIVMLGFAGGITYYFLKRDVSAIAPFNESQEVHRSRYS